MFSNSLISLSLTNLNTKLLYFLIFFLEIEPSAITAIANRQIFKSKSSLTLKLLAAFIISLRLPNESFASSNL